MIWRSLYGILVVLSVAGSSAWAQTRDRHVGERDVKVTSPRQKAVRPLQKSCAEYGPGFVRVEGSSSCVRIGGGISVDVGTGR
jgi:hypothetical protein